MSIGLSATWLRSSQIAMDLILPVSWVGYDGVGRLDDWVVMSLMMGLKNRQKRRVPSGHPCLAPVFDLMVTMILPCSVMKRSVGLPPYPNWTMEWR